MSAAPHIDATVEPRLDWLALTEALAAGHALPKGDIADSFLYRGRDTILSRAAWIDGLGALVKTATIFPGNSERGQPGINGAVTLLSDTDGSVAATLDFHLVTKWKTAADSLLAARRLARPDSERILICGAGHRGAIPNLRLFCGFPESQFYDLEPQPSPGRRAGRSNGRATRDRSRRGGAPGRYCLWRDHGHRSMAARGLAAARSTYRLDRRLSPPTCERPTTRP